MSTYLEKNKNLSNNIHMYTKNTSLVNDYTFIEH